MNVEKRTKRLFIASIMAATAMGHSARAEPPVFTDSGQLLGNSNSYFAALGDVDGDGDLDAFVPNYASQADKVWLNDGTGCFTDSGQNLDPGNRYSNTAILTDLDGDGDLDAFVLHNGGFISAAIHSAVLWNDGTGIFTDSGQHLFNEDAWGIDLGDLDGDGDLDAFIANAWNRANKVWLNEGSGVFSDSGQSLGNSHSHRLALGDLDGDGDLDAFVPNAGQPNKVWLNDGAGIFTDSGQAIGNSQSLGVALEDLDGDGDLDAFISNRHGQPNKVWLNDGSGIFSDSGQNLGNSSSKETVLADLDNDGDLDAFVPNEGANKIWLNNGLGIFTDSGQNFGNSTSMKATLGDLDGDGDLDAFVSNRENQANKVWLNQSPLPPAAESCEPGKQAVYDLETEILDIPYVDIPIMNPVTGALTGEIAVFKAQLLKASGINDFSIIPGSFGYMDLAADYNPLHARYTYVDDSIYANGGLFHMPCVYVPSIIVIPPGIQVPGPIQIYEVTLRQLAAEPEILHIYEAAYLDTIDP
ncbi:MAG: VCBS repeat-containing protein [Gammaproteobacteria bacterium]|nr:VCBS repeat-containing protein [Gammaproteobacteria bacterium]